MLNKTVEDRFRNFVEVDIQSHCWNWLGGKSKIGYGYFWDSKKHGLAHRYSYESRFGKIPEDLEIDHLCRNKSCVNPAHLEMVTRKMNMLRGNNTGSRKDYCIRGHKYTPDNCLKRENGIRRCRVCHNLRWKERKNENR